MAQFFTVASESVGERRVKFIASTLTVDRHGTKLLPAGCKTENFLKNPVFLACHNRESLDAVLGLVVDIRVTADDVAITVEFDTTPEADKALVRIRKGFLRAVSVGFQPIKQNPEFDSPDEEAAFLASGGVIVISEWELIEVSLVPIGSNPEALIANRSFTVACFPSNSKLRVASVLCLNPEGKQLWGKRNDSGKYTTPGGKLAANEDPLLGACRELFEEANITVKPDQLKYLGLVSVPAAQVFCYSVNVDSAVNPSGVNDPDKEVTNWEWLDSCPADSDLHAKPNALIKWARNISPVRTRTITNQTQSKTTEPVTKMSNEEILAKLGLAAGAKPEEITAALIKFASGSDPDKEAVITGLLAMLTPAAPAAPAQDAAAPAPSASSASDGAKAEGLELALKMAEDEMTKMRAEMDELRKRAEGADKPAEKPAPAADDSEERAAKAIKAGQWPLTQRGVLVDIYKAKKTAYLFKEGTFSTRGMVFTEGGNPTTGKPRIGADAAGSVIKTDVQKAFALAERNIGSSTGVKR